MIRQILLRMVIAGGALGAMFLIIDPLLPPPIHSLNDLQYYWLIMGKNFFVPSDETGPMSLKTNPELVKQDNTIEQFSAQKHPKSFRIFCVGGSTTQGWPFHKAISYPKLFEYYLRDLLPDKNVEVINAGFMASDSHSDIALFRELLDYSPDLILVYEGRNERGNFPLHAGWRSKVLYAHVGMLRRIRMYNYFRNKIFPIDTQKFNLARDIRRIYGIKDNKQKMVEASFTENLKTMRDLALKYGCQIAVITQARSVDEQSKASRIAAINARIRDFSNENEIPLIDIDKAFQRSTLPIADLVIPYSVHPTLKGYALMARTVCRSLSNQNIIAPQNQWRWNDLRDDRVYFEASGLTAMVLADAYFRVGNALVYFGLEHATKYYVKTEEALPGFLKDKIALLTQKQREAVSLAYQALGDPVGQ